DSHSAQQVCGVLFPGPWRSSDEPGPRLVRVVGVVGLFLDEIGQHGHDGIWIPHVCESFAGCTGRAPIGDVDMTTNATPTLTSGTPGAVPPQAPQPVTPSTPSTPGAPAGAGVRGWLRSTLTTFFA